MADIPFLTDVKIMQPSELESKVTLALSDTGDIQLVEGKEKLLEQLLRAVVNEDTLNKDILNQPNVSTRKLLTLFTLILRNFRSTQIDQTNRSDPDFSGFIFFRKASGTNDSYSKVSTDPIIYKFTDTGLENGKTYDYGVSKIYKNIFESSYIDKFTIKPTAFTYKQEIIIGSNVTAIAGSSQITFYVDYNKKFRTSELLERILGIDVQQDPTEPRKWNIHITIEDLEGNKVSIAAKRLDPITGKAVY